MNDFDFDETCIHNQNGICLKGLLWDCKTDNTVCGSYEKRGIGLDDWM